MTNVQARLIATAIAMLAGAVASSTDNLDINVGIAILFIASALFLVEYVRAQRS